MKLKNPERYVDMLIVILAMVVSASVVVTVHQSNKTKAENKELKTELRQKNKTLKTTKERLAVYEDYLKNAEARNANVVTDKYTNGSDYTVRVGKDYYSVSYETFINLAIGQQVDASGWEKHE